MISSNIFQRILVAFFAASISCTTAQHNQDRQIKKYVDSLTTKTNFNGSVLASVDGRIIYKGHFGLADFNTGQKLNDSTIFLLCSISKQFTAMGIMLLKEQGRLRYDDDIQKYIPELPYKGISIRHMLTHTSGIPKYEEILEQRVLKNSIAHNEDIIKTLQEVKPPLLFQPGERWEYCDTAYELLATVIERASGVSYGDFLAKNIFRPLNMRNTFNCITRRTNKQPLVNYALPFVYVDSLNKYLMPDSLKKFHFVITLDGTQGAGSINATVEDMYRWDRALTTEKIVKAATLSEAFTPVKLNDGQTFNYGFGWCLAGSPANRIAMHSGAWVGYRSFIIRGLDKHNFVIALSNNESDANLLAKKIYEKISNETLKQWP